MVSLIARPLRSMRGAVQARAPLTRGAAHAAALLAPCCTASPAVFAIGTAVLTRTAGRASCCMRPRMSAASASDARFLLRTDTSAYRGSRNTKSLGERRQPRLDKAARHDAVPGPSLCRARLHWHSDMAFCGLPAEVFIGRH